jgi:hypothetical protein
MMSIFILLELTEEAVLPRRLTPFDNILGMPTAFLGFLIRLLANKIPEFQVQQVIHSPFDRFSGPLCIIS